MENVCRCFQLALKAAPGRANSRGSFVRRHYLNARFLLRLTHSQTWVQIPKVIFLSVFLYAVSAWPLTHSFICPSLLFLRLILFWLFILEDLKKTPHQSAPASLSSAQGITTASPPPPTTLRVRGYHHLGPSPPNTSTREAPRRSSSSSVTLQEVVSRLSGVCVCVSSNGLYCKKQRLAQTYSAYLKAQMFN